MPDTARKTTDSYDQREDQTAFIRKVELESSSRLDFSTFTKRGPSGAARGVVFGAFNGGHSANGLPNATASVSSKLSQLSKHRRKFPKLTKRVLLSCAAIFLGSEIAIAEILRQVGPDLVAQLSSKHSVVITDVSGASFSLQNPSETILSHPLTEPAAFERLELYGQLLVFKEDRGLGHDLRPDRYLGIDLPATVKGFASLFTDSPRGGSTIPQQTCSRIYDSWSSPSIGEKLKEMGCAMVLTAQTHGDADKLILLAAENHPSAIGARGSSFGAAIHGVEAGSKVLFGQPFSTLNECQVAMLVASHQSPVKVKGSQGDTQQVKDSWAKGVAIAQRDFERFRISQGENLSISNLECFAELKLSTHTLSVAHPASTLGDAGPELLNQIRAEATEIDGSGFSLSLNINHFIQGRRAVSRELCRLGRRKSVTKNLCEANGKIGAQVRVFILDPEGKVVIGQALGPGAHLALREPDTGYVPSRGSLAKGLYLSALRGVPLCREAYHGIQDAGGHHGYTRKQCRSGIGRVSLEDTAAYSYNLSTISGLRRIDDEQLSLIKSRLGYAPDISVDQLALGTKSLSLQKLMASYSALSHVISGNPPIGYAPHYLTQTRAEKIDLAGLTGDAAFTKKLFSGALRYGTARQFARITKSNGLNIVTAKTGTSESDKTNERGKHIAGTLERNGVFYTYFVEISTADSSPLSSSGVLSTADLANLLIAATKDNF